MDLLIFLTGIRFFASFFLSWGRVEGALGLQYPTVDVVLYKFISGDIFQYQSKSADMVRCKAISFDISLHQQISFDISPYKHLSLI